VSATLLRVLERSLQVMHPIMPFVTEEVWSFLPGERALLAASPWPAVDESLLDEEAEAVVGRTIAAITALRRYRDDVGAAAGARIPAALVAEGYEHTREHVARLARFELAERDGAEPVATVAIPGGAVHVLPTDQIDTAEAERRRGAQREQLEGEIARAEKKLANEQFVAKAPAAVVDGERAKLERYRRELAELS
jgi:valyl-tRNA synthetase